MKLSDVLTAKSRRRLGIDVKTQTDSEVRTRKDLYSSSNRLSSSFLGLFSSNGGLFENNTFTGIGSSLEMSIS
jgi:hypothetical protein